MCSLVATDFHNAAVEYEHVKDYPSSLIHYQKAAKIAQIHLGKFHNLTKRFTDNFELAK